MDLETERHNVEHFPHGTLDNGIACYNQCLGTIMRLKVNWKISIKGNACSYNEQTSFFIMMADPLSVGRYILQIFWYILICSNVTFECAIFKCKTG